jgi:hypothetical protein
MGNRKRQRSTDEWKSLVEQWKASGLGGKTFAEQHGLSFSSLYRWAHVFEGKPRTKLGFAEVRVRETSSSTMPEAGAIEIVGRTGWVIRVTGTVDVARLRAVLEAVKSC